MGSERERRIEELLSTVGPLEPTERNLHLERACAGDDELRAEIESRLSTRRLGEDAGEAATFLVDGPATEERAILSGSRVGSCELIRLLAEGGMGAVYEATQDPFGRRVAVKLMKGGLVSQQARQRFAYEARLVASLRHPGIAQVFESGTHEQPGGLAVPYIVMELIPDARPLTLYVWENELDEDAIFDLFGRVCDAVHYAHQRGVIHRDLKPANVLVDAAGQPKVIDFGLARDLEDELATRSFQTATGAFVGTVPYMSPEQLGGDSALVDIRSDVYALGIILFELLCRRRPHDISGLALPDAVARIRERAAPRPSSFGVAVPRDVETILAKALRQHPDDRYPSANALAEDLRLFRRGLPIQARPATLSYQLRLFTRRNRVLVLAGMLLLVVVIAAAVVSLVFAVRAEDARRRERARADEAEQLLAGTRSFAEWMMLELLGEMRDLPGATTLSEKMVGRVLEHLDSISSEAARDPRHQRVIALAYLEVGMLQGVPTDMNLGLATEALANVERAATIFERLWTAAPDSREALLDLVVARASRAELLSELGRIDEVEAILTTDIARLEERGAREWTGARAARVLANEYENLAELASERGRWEPAEAELRVALAVREATWRRTNEAADRRSLGAVRQALADVMISAGRFEEAEDLVQAAASDFEASHGAHFESPSALSDRAAVHRTRGDALVGLDEREEALEEFETSLALRERVCAIKPDDVLGLRGLASSLARVGNVTTAWSDPATALPYYRRALEIERRIAAGNPSAVGILSRLRIAVHGVAQALVFAGELTEAEVLVVEEETLARRIVEVDPSNPQGRRGLAEARSAQAFLVLTRATLGEGEAAAADFELAKRHFEAAVAIYDELLSEGHDLAGLESMAHGARAQLDLCVDAMRRLEEIEDRD